MKYRAKFNTPFIKKGDIYTEDYLFPDPNSHPYIMKTAAGFPDLFEPVEEEEKVNLLNCDIEVPLGVPIVFEKENNRVSYKIYKEVCGEG